MIIRTKARLKQLKYFITSGRLSIEQVINKMRSLTKKGFDSRCKKKTNHARKETGYARDLEEDCFNTHQ